MQPAAALVEAALLPGHVAKGELIITPSPFVKADPMKPGVATGEAKKITNNLPKSSHVYTSPGIMTF